MVLPKRWLGVRTDHISSECIHWTRSQEKPLSPGQMSGRRAGSVWRSGSSLLLWQLPGLTLRGLLACQALEKDSGPRVYLWENAQISQAAQGPVTARVFIHTQSLYHATLGSLGSVTSSEQATPPTDMERSKHKVPGTHSGAHSAVLSLQRRTCHCARGFICVCFISVL